MNQSESESKAPLTKKQTKKINLIQVYRGLAAVLVLLTHANLIFKREVNHTFLQEMFDFGWSGVDFFFVLSGFIIFYINYSDIGCPSKYKSFILKRFVRIYPLYWIILSCKIGACLLFSYGSDSVQPNFWDYLKAITLFPQENKQLLFAKFLGVSWTLSYEILFYLLFSLLILLGYKVLKPFIVIWLLGCLLNLIGVVGILKDNFLLNFIFNERNLEFLFGIASAYLILKFPIKHPMRLISVAAFLLTISAINSNYNLVKISSVISYGIPFMLLIIGSVAIENSRDLKIPNSLIQIGDSSYAIYLIHGFIIVNICRVLLKSPLSGIFQNFILVNLIGIIICIMVIAIGAIIYHYIEKPLLTSLRINLIDKMSKKPSRSTL